MKIKDLLRHHRNPDRQAAATQTNYGMDNGTNEKIKIGVLGPGDVFKYRFLPQLTRHSSFELHSVADVVPEGEKMEHIRRMTRKNPQYYQIDPDEIPEPFFDGLDVVYIASPNKFHLPQTLASLHRGIFTVTEKPLVRNREEFDVLKRDAENYFSALFCQDHHILKPVTMCALDKIPELIAEYGNIEHVEVTFLERGNLQGLERERWLISPEAGGGILIDVGTHMTAILTKVFNGDFVDCGVPQFYDMYPNYVYPHSNFECETGFYGNFWIQGQYFMPSEKPNVTMRIAKGVGSSRKKCNLPGMENNEVKLIEVNLENADLLLNYMFMGAESEFNGNGNRISKSPGYGLRYDGKYVITHSPELEPGFYLIKDGTCTNLINDIVDERHEYLRLFDKIQDGLRSGSPFLDIYDAEKALTPVFMAYDRAGGVHNMRLENGYSDN